MKKIIASLALAPLLLIGTPQLAQAGSNNPTPDCGTGSNAPACNPACDDVLRNYDIVVKTFAANLENANEKIERQHKRIVRLKHRIHQLQNKR